MNEVKFDLDQIEKTFTKYSDKGIHSAFVVQKRDNGAIVNIGGKNDAFIKKDEFDDYASVKLGDCFDCMITKMKNEEGFIEVSKTLADSFADGQRSASKIKVGSRFSCVITNSSNAGLHSKLGEYSIFIPASQVASKSFKPLEDFKNKRVELAAIEVDQEKQNIIGSIRILEEETDRMNQDNFFRSIFENKIVIGTVKKIMPYGAFIEVEGVDCFLHISEASYERISKIENVLELGKKYAFKVISVDRVQGKVNLSYKQTLPKPSVAFLQSFAVGDTLTCEVIKLLSYGAILKTENGATGMLHISKATTQENKSIHEIVKLGDKLDVEIIEIDVEKNRLSFMIPNLKAGE